MDNPAVISASFNQGKLARLGRISQLAYVPDDFERSLSHWIRMGVGPFLRIDHVKTTEGMYLGKPANIDFGAAIGYWGEMQIELIQQHNDVASIYKGWKNHPEGDRLHHTCLTVDDLNHACQVVTDSGGFIVQGGTLTGGTRFVYAKLDDMGPAQFLEIAQVSEATRQSMTQLQMATRNWDGRDPVRVMP